MDSWEIFFREKSKRRWAGEGRDRLLKSAVVLVLIGGVATAVILRFAGLR